MNLLSDASRRALLLAITGSSLATRASARTTRRPDFEDAPLDAPPPGFTLRLTGGRPAPRDRWQVLGPGFGGSRFTVSLAGRDVLTATDATHRDAGPVGLGIKADSVTHFDSFEVEGLP
ncbi:MAG: hypothetical protein JWQ03_999 [Variovorax sp.]|nr:hypothetical protein [Variovorax sp.]